MGLKKRLTAVIVIAIAAGIIFGVAKTGKQVSEKKEESIFSSGKETLYLWYTDDAITSYLSSAAVTYNESHDVRIVPVLESGLEYLEKINQTSIDSNAPDLYIISHDSLEKAYLAGLASEIKPNGRIILDEAYIGEGLKAAAYKNRIIGYPFYFETSSLLYNKSYLEDFARAQMETEANVKEAEESQAQLEKTLEQADSAGVSPEDAVEAAASGTQESMPVSDEHSLVEERVKEFLPSTIEEIKSFADSYDAPEQLESIFKWDVTDIFYNYFIVGDVINVGGEAGWDTSGIDIYNLNAIQALKVYQGLNQFFSIDTSEINYDSVLEEFTEGKILFTVATTDAVAKLEQAKADGKFPYEYGVTQTPAINDEMNTRSLSVTSCVVVNGYAQNKEAANDFAYFLTAEFNPSLYARTGKVSAAAKVDYGNEALDEFAKEYSQSISMPKMVETGNFWVQLEASFAEIWNGADVNGKLKVLSEKIKEQITGRPYSEELITEPEEEKQEVEYLDEEYYRQEAQNEE